MPDKKANKKQGFGTAPVFFTAIATILGAILFLRFGYAVGTVGFGGVLLIILLGHLVTIPTSLSLSEIATNQKVEGGGEYFIISRSFGLNIGAAIGIALYLSQAVSVAFYIIAFTEAFTPLFDLLKDRYDILLPRQAISLPSMALLAILILTKGANMGVKALYFVVAILFVSLTMFFLGTNTNQESFSVFQLENSFKNMDQFFLVFAIIFPAFTGMTAGVGLSGDLKNPSKSIPLGSITATVLGMIVYVFISWKFSVSATEEALTTDQLVMSQIAVGGNIAILAGLAASTLSSAIGSIMVAPRTLQALSLDNFFPFGKINRILAKGKGNTNEPFNASILTIIIAFVFVALGDVDIVARIISMFFMITYGSLNLISFLYHFGGDPFYRPTFRSNKTLSLIGFLVSLWLMFKMDAFYTIVAAIVMTLLYIIVSLKHKDRRGVEEIFRGAIFHIGQKIQLLGQRSSNAGRKKRWRPCILSVSGNRNNTEGFISLLHWLSSKYGYSTLFYLQKDYYSRSSADQAMAIKQLLINNQTVKNSNIYIDSIVSPSFTSAVGQLMQTTSVFGENYNTALFDISDPESKKEIEDNWKLLKLSGLDICLFKTNNNPYSYKNGISIWVDDSDVRNVNLTLMLSYIILNNQAWQRAKLKLNILCNNINDDKYEEILRLIQKGRLPININNIKKIEFIAQEAKYMFINKEVGDNTFTIIGIRSTEKPNLEILSDLSSISNLMLVEAAKKVEIK